MATTYTPAQIIAALQNAVNSGQDDESRITAVIIALTNLSQSIGAIVTPTAIATGLTDSDTISVLQNGQFVQYSASDLTTRFQLLVNYLNLLGFDLPEELFVDNTLINS
jgi:hypothetical protein